MSNGNQVTRMAPRPTAAPQGGQPTQQGGWSWSGSNWVCDGDSNGPPWFDPQTAPWYPGANAGVSFGPAGAFPSFPIRGNFFWDGVTLWMFDGAAWVSVGGSGGGFKGVTDGSSAAPGVVGEFLVTTVAVNYAASPTITSVTIDTLIVTPGDWTCWASIEYTQAVGFLGFNLAPFPAGASGDIRGQVGSFSSAGVANYAGVMGSATRCSFTVPTVLSFAVFIDQAPAGLVAGIAYLTACARRAR